MKRILSIILILVAMLLASCGDLDRPVSDETQDTFALPLKARDEMIGKLAVQGLTHEDQGSVDLVNAVAERLGAHIESLRLFEETKRGQVELDKRAKQLAAVAEISTVSSRELDIQKMLAAVVHLTQRRFGLYHAHVFIYNEQAEQLEIEWHPDGRMAMNTKVHMEPPGFH